tara:strand:- start:2011 stop:2877 length:867 start_codon:yes stop_codon:yes gene_type:complete
MATLAVTNTFSAGTTIVAADVNQNNDDIEAFVNTTPGVVQNDIVDVLGDLIVATGADAVGRLAAGTNTHVLTADSTTATGLSWVAPTTGDITGVTTAAASGLAGGATSGTAALTFSPAGLTAAQNFGADGAGVDITFHSATAGDNMLWDASEEKLVITGTNGANALEVADGNVSITDDLTVTGNLTSHLNVATDSTAAIAPALGDENKYVLSTHATAVVTLPQNSAQAFAIGATIYYERNGTGTLTFAAGTGATVTSKDSTLTCKDRYTTICALKIGTNAWSLIGNVG